MHAGPFGAGGATARAKLARRLFGERTALAHGERRDRARERRGFCLPHHHAGKQHGGNPGKNESELLHGFLPGWVEKHSTSAATKLSGREAHMAQPDMRLVQVECTPVSRHGM